MARGARDGFNWLVHEINRHFAVQGVPYARGRLLDLGCGRQPYRALYEPVVERYVGLDNPASGMPADAEVYGDAMALPFGAQSFQTVTAFQVLEHMADPAVFVTEAFRVLAPGGHLILATPFLWGIHDAPRDFFRYTPFGLEHLLRRAGFEVVRVEPTCGLWAAFGLRVLYRLYGISGIRALHPLFWVANRALGWLDHLDFVASDAGGYFSIACRRRDAP